MFGKKYSTGKINFRGGIISTGDLKFVIDMLKDSGCDKVELGERQNMYFRFENSKKETIRIAAEKHGIDCELNSNVHPNIVSSYVVEDIFTYHPWISEGMYRDILNSFNYKPKLKVNIADNTQALVPLFTGNLNFIPSSHFNFYYAFIRLPFDNKLFCWDTLMQGNDIALFSKWVETQVNENKKLDAQALKLRAELTLKMPWREITEPLSIPRLRFPYYEGMNRYIDKFWLGIYRRNNDFSTALLESIYDLSQATRIGQIYLTPWKSIMIKGIQEEERIEWERLLSLHGINSRHSSLELNWQLADLDAETLRIKNALVKDFDENDIRTYGLTFAIHSEKDFDYSSSVLIKKKESAFPFWGIFKALTTYDIYYDPSFSMNAGKYELFEKNIPWNGLSIYLRNVSKRFYKQLNETSSLKKQVQQEKTKTNDVLYECQDCLTVYDEKIGEPQSDIAPATAFDLLPESFCCPLCDAAKSNFVKKEMLAVAV